MNQSVKTIIYPVKNLTRAKAFFGELLGVNPHADYSYYAGFKVGDQDIDIGLDPHGHKDGMRVYYRVEDIKKSLQLLVDSGAQVLQEVKDSGGGGLIASVKDEDGNIIGLIQ